MSALHVPGRHALTHRMIGISIASAVACAGMTALAPSARAAGDHLGAVTDFSVSPGDPDQFLISAGGARVRISVLDDDLIRVEAAPDGHFTDPANDDPADPDAPAADIVVKKDYAPVPVETDETATAYTISTDKATLTINKSPLTLSMTDADGDVLWSEASPLSWTDDSMTQHLKRGANEQFFGGGMQNGRFTHRGDTIEISKDYDWNDGGHPNAVPFYLSSNGYGVLRDTFAPGSYSFTAPTTTTHREKRFDAYYFVGDAKQAINGYTELTGRPLALPMYALEIGDADCYLHNANRGERHTLPDATAIAQGYLDHDMPLGWELVNDGYGCGYEQLPETGDALHQRGAELGLWTEADLTDQQSEVEAGVRVRKTDVAWVGPGYRQALSACEKAKNGIERYSNDRATVVTIEGWAGTQRCGTMWSGDQSGSWDYIRWQIPTYAGSTMSGQPVTFGDVDGIFGGSAKTYVRDLQWKMFLPMTYAMSGWAGSDKQPWRYGEPYTSINRRYLQLHERLLPYFYTYLMQAHHTGVGPTRPLYLNYPNDPVTATEAVKYEFLAGDDFLVAPVYSDTDTRDGIYLPKGTWIDYWSGQLHSGRQTVNGYHAPLDTLPLFVRAGAIIPMFPEGTLDWEAGKASGQLDLDIWPQGDSSFTNYEDDGRSQAFRSGASAEQTFTVSAPEQGRGTVTVTLGALQGTYDGKPASRAYHLSVHTGSEPGSVLVGNQRLAHVADAAALEDTGTGWYYDSTDKGGTVHIRTASLDTGASATVRLNGASAVGGIHDDELDVDLTLESAQLAIPDTPSTTTATFTNDTGKPVPVQLSVRAPDGWTVSADGATSADALPDGQTLTARFSVTAPGTAEPGPATLQASATYRPRDTTRTTTTTAEVEVPYSSLAAAFNNVGTTTEANPAPGDLDGGGSSFINERLTEAGAAPGSTVTVDGTRFTWPEGVGTPNNVASSGQTVALSGQGNALAFLGTNTGFTDGAITVHYADGSTSGGRLGFPNWCCASTDDYGSTVAFTTHGKNTPDGPAYPSVAYRIFRNQVFIDPGKQVVAVTLPSSSAVHVFAATVATVPTPAPPTDTVAASSLDPISASNGWGPYERNTSNGESAAGDGGPITLNGTVYDSGLGTNAVSTITYYTGGACARFTATVGVDDEVSNRGSVTFAVSTDGVQQVQTPVLRGDSDSVPISVDVRGARTVTLTVGDGGDGPGSDHGDWADATFTCSN